MVHAQEQRCASYETGFVEGWPIWEPYQSVGVGVLQLPQLFGPIKGCTMSHSAFEVIIEQRNGQEAVHQSERKVNHSSSSTAAQRSTGQHRCHTAVRESTFCARRSEATAGALFLPSKVFALRRHGSEVNRFRFLGFYDNVQTERDIDGDLYAHPRSTPPQFGAQQNLITKQAQRR